MRNKRINRKDFEKLLAKEIGTTITTAKELTKVFDFLYKFLTTENTDLYINGLGVFHHKQTKEKRAIVPGTDKEVVIPSRDKIVFKLTGWDSVVSE